METGISLQNHEVNKVYFNIENAELARANKNAKHCQKKAPRYTLFSGSHPSKSQTQKSPALSKAFSF